MHPNPLAKKEILGAPLNYYTRPSYIRVRAAVWACGRGQTNKQTRVTFRVVCTKLNQLMELVAAAKLLQLKNFVVVTEDLVGDFLTKFYSCRK